MKYFFDTEFIEDGKTIELVSIGIVSELGREYYAVSTEFDASKAVPWVVENVLNHLTVDGVRVEPDAWKPRAQIREEILAFVGNKPEFVAYCSSYDWVVLAQLFGRMIDLPKHFPHWCFDLKQLAEMKVKHVKPIQTNIHHALDDAKWNKLYYSQLIELPYKDEKFMDRNGINLKERKKSKCIK